MVSKQFPLQRLGSHLSVTLVRFLEFHYVEFGIWEKNFNYVETLRCKSFAVGVAPSSRQPRNYLRKRLAARSAAIQCRSPIQCYRKAMSKLQRQLPLRIKHRLAR